MGETMISSMDVVNNLHSKYKIADVEANSHLFVGVREISQPIFLISLFELTLRRMKRRINV